MEWCSRVSRGSKGLLCFGLLVEDHGGSHFEMLAYINNLLQTESWHKRNKNFLLFHYDFIFQHGWTLDHKFSQSRFSFLQRQRYCLSWGSCLTVSTLCSLGLVVIFYFTAGNAVDVEWLISTAITQTAAASLWIGSWKGYFYMPRDWRSSICLVFRLNACLHMKWLSSNENLITEKCICLSMVC